MFYTHFEVLFLYTINKNKKNSEFAEILGISSLRVKDSLAGLCNQRRLLCEHHYKNGLPIASCQLFHPFDCYLR